jgi:hypothetical protein
VHNRRNYIEQEPRATEDDRLHRVKPHEAVSFFQNVKDDSTHQGEAGDGRGHIRGQIHR